jgi:hypothetical protein
MQRTSTEYYQDDTAPSPPMNDEGMEWIEEVPGQPNEPWAYESCNSCGSCDACESCAPCAPPAPGGCGFYGGAEFTYLKPHYDHGLTTLIHQFSLMPGGGAMPATYSGYEFADVPWNYQGAPRGWIGYEDASGFGVRGRWWSFDQSTAEETIQTLSYFGLGRMGLDAYTVDLEATQQIAGGPWAVVGFAGMRYAEITTTIELEQTALNGQDFSDAYADFMSKMSGVGPTMGVEGFRSLFWGLGLYGSARMSILYGNGKEREYIHTVNTSVPSEMLILNSRDDLMMIFDLKIGVEWTHDLSGGTTIFARGSLEAQDWQSAYRWEGTGSNDIGFFGFAGAVGVGF